MNKERLKELIEIWENPKLDFKREWYWNKNMPKEVKTSQQGDFVRDVIALANGHPDFIGQVAYLIIGIEDDTKKIYNFDKSVTEPFDKFKQQIVEIVNNYAQPNIIDLDINWVKGINEKVLVISIKPQKDVIHIFKDLQTPKGTIDRGTTFFRVGENNRVASPDVTEKLKEAIKKYKEQEKNRQKAEQLKSSKLFKLKREIDDEDGSYKNQKDRIFLFAILPVINDFEARLTIECEIEIILESSTKIMIHIDERDVLENLFSGYKFKPQKRNNQREWIIFFDEKSNLYTIRISSTVLDVPYKTIETLSEMLDDLQEVYVSKLNSIEDRLNSKSFPCSQEYRNGFELCQIDLPLWRKIQEFVIQHDYLHEGEWNIFNAYSRPTVRNITIYDIKSNKVILELAFKIDDSDVIKPEITLIWNTLDVSYDFLNDTYMSVEESFFWIRDKLIPQIKKESFKNQQNYNFKFLKKESKEEDLFKIYALKEEQENSSSLQISAKLLDFFGYNEVVITKDILRDLYKGLILLFENSERLDDYYLYKKFYNIGSKQTIPQDFEKPEDYFSRKPTREYFLERINIEINDINKGDLSLSELLWGYCTLNHILSCYTVIIRENFDSYSDVIIYDIEQSLKGLKEIYDVLKVRERRLGLI